MKETIPEQKIQHIYEVCRGSIQMKSISTILMCCEALRDKVEIRLDKS